MAGYGSFDNLSVADDAQLRDFERVRRLYRERFRGVVPLSCGLLAMAALAGGVALFAAVSVVSGRGELRDTPWTPILVFGLLSGIAALLAIGFLLDAKRSPLARYQAEPERFGFARGELRKAYLLRNEGRRSSGTRVNGSFRARDGREIPLFEDFEPGFWNAVFERGRLRLPIPVWVLYRLEPPCVGCMVGVPKELADRGARAKRA